MFDMFEQRDRRPGRRKVMTRFLRLLMPAFVLSVMVIQAAYAEVEIRLSLPDPKGSSTHKAVMVFKETVEDLSKGEVKVLVFPGGALGTYQQGLENIRAGGLTVQHDSLGDLNPFTEIAGVEGVPYLYTSADEHTKVWSSEAAQELLDTIAKETGFRFLGPGFRGFRDMCLKVPVKSAEDLAGVKIRSPALPAYMNALKALGANPTPIAYEEAYTAIQQGVVDGIEIPVSLMLDVRFYEVCDQLVVTRHLAEIIGFTFNETWYQSQSKDVREWLNEAAVASADWYKRTTLENREKTIAELKSKGMTVHEPDLAEFVDRAKKMTFSPTVQYWIDRLRKGI